MAMKMVSARVPEDKLAGAQAVLEEQGKTVSDLIRIAIEYTSATGEVPDVEKTVEERRREERMKTLHEVLQYFEEKPLTGMGPGDVRELAYEGWMMQHEQS